MAGSQFIKLHDANESYRTQRIAFVHHKGGTGKTTACLNVAGWLTKLNQKVLVIDLDPQANATTGLGVDLKSVEHSLYDVLLRGHAIHDIILETHSGVYLAPATAELISAEIELAKTNHPASVLTEKLENIGNHFNFILIDSPPGSTMLMINGIVAAKNIIIPLDAGVFGYETLETLKTLILDLEDELQISIHILMGLLKIFSPALLFQGFTKKIRKMITHYFSENGLQQCSIYNIPISKKICMAQMKGMPISHYAPSSQVSLAYQHIANTILKFFGDNGHEQID